MKIRMIGLDLDGTLLNNKKQLTARNREVLEEAIRRGVVVLPATGRHASGIQQSVREIAGLRYAVAANGAQVVDLQTGESLITASIPWERGLQVIDRLREFRGENWEVYYNENCYVDSAYQLQTHKDMSREFVEYLEKSRCRVEHLYEKLHREQQDLDKIHMLFRDTESRDACLAVMEKEFPDLVVTYALSSNMEFFSREAGKGNALLALGRKLGIAREEIMCFGDAHNDWDMLQKVGFPVVMENGDEETKQLAAYITKTNEEDGVAWAVEKFVLKEEA